MKKRSSHHNTSYGTLHVVSTPIGNLEDITLRALKVLKDSDLIAAESVRHTKGLCRHYRIDTRLTSYHQHNRKAKGPLLINQLKHGSDIALVTNAGTPAVSDPGTFLIKMALDEEIRVSPVPGPSAVTAALSVSGLRVDQFLFSGFLSSRPGKRKKELKKLILEPRTIVLFEAPHRVQAMLTDLMEILGDRHMVMLRELTKIYEEVNRGPISTILKGLKPEKIKGEFTLLVEGNEAGEADLSPDARTQRRIERLIKENKISIKEIATQISEEQGLPYRTLYRECLSIKKTMQK